MTRTRASAKAAGSRFECPRCGISFVSDRPNRRWCSAECCALNYRDSRRHPRRVKPAAERVIAKTVRTSAGCLNFTGYLNASGYGVINTGSKGNPSTSLAHRVVWVASRGAIPEGLVVRHRCDNPACVEVGHMELGTHLDNMQDRDRRGRTLQGEAVGRHKLTWRQVQEIRRLCSAGVTHRVIATQFGISTAQVSYIRNYKSRCVA